MNYLKALLFIFGLGIATPISAQFLKTVQLQDTSLAPTLSGTLFKATPNTYTLIGRGNFGIDSAYIQLIELDTNFEAGASNSFALPGLALFNDAEPTLDGYLIGGSNFSSAISWPFLIKTDQDLALKWSLTFGNLAISQTHIVKVFSDNTDFIAFSYSSPGNRIVHRIRGDLNGNAVTAYSIENVDKRFRFNNGIAAGVPKTHIMGGTIEDQASNETDALIASWGANNLNWSKSIDFGAAGTEEFRRFTPQENGEFLATVVNFNVEASKAETFLCKMDTSGQIMWVKKLSLPTGNANLGGISLTPTGDVLLSGLTNNLDATVIKLNPQGDLIWSKKWIWPNEYWSGIQDLYIAPNGQITVQLGNMGSIYFSELESDGAGCNFENGPAIEISPFTEFTENNSTFIRSNLAVTAIPVDVSPRTLTLETSAFCTNMPTAIEKLEFEEEDLLLYPQPAQDILHVQTTTNYNKGQIQIFNSVGQVVLEIPFSNSFSIKQLNPGWYVFRILWGNKTIIRPFIKGN